MRKFHVRCGGENERDGKLEFTIFNIDAYCVFENPFYLHKNYIICLNDGLLSQIILKFRQNQAHLFRFIF